MEDVWETSLFILLMVNSELLDDGNTMIFDINRLMCFLATNIGKYDDTFNAYRLT